MPKVSRSRRRADRIREVVPMVRVLYDYGYAVNPDGEDREQQFPCELHGDGRDGKPSGRLYPTSNSMYCFACGRARDAVSLVMEKEGLKFIAAVERIERLYGLPHMPDDGPGDDTDDDVSLSDVFADHPVPYADAAARTDRFLRRLTQARALSIDDATRMWWTFDRIRHGVDREGWSDAKAAADVDALREAVRHAVGITDG